MEVKRKLAFAALIAVLTITFLSVFKGLLIIALK